METLAHKPSANHHGPPYTFFVDDREFTVAEAELTGAQIMAVAGVSAEQGLLLVLEDGTQRAVAPTEVIELKPGHRLKKAPRFKRG